MGDLMILMTSLRLQQAFAQQRQQRRGDGRGAEDEVAVVLVDRRGARRGTGGSRRLVRRRVWPRLLGILAVVSLQIVCRQ